MKSCLICDDHALMRDALAATIKTRWPEADCHTARDFDEAWAAAGRLHPSLCLVDLVMPGATPVAGVTRLMEAAPQARLVVVTGSGDDQVLLELLRLGVHGFIQKTEPGDVIVRAIDLVMSGGRYLPPRVAELATGDHALSPANATPRGQPTERQRAVLALIATGKSNKDIARVLGVAPATVKTHVTNALAAVGAANRTEAAIRAQTMGLI